MSRVANSGRREALEKLILVGCNQCLPWFQKTSLFGTEVAINSNPTQNLGLALCRKRSIQKLPNFVGTFHTTLAFRDLKPHPNLALLEATKADIFWDVHGFSGSKNVPKFP